MSKNYLHLGIAYEKNTTTHIFNTSVFFSESESTITNSYININSKLTFIFLVIYILQIKLRPIGS